MELQFQFCQKLMVTLSSSILLSFPTIWFIDIYFFLLAVAYLNLDGEIDMGKKCK